MNKTPSLYQEKFKKISTTDADVTDDASSNRKYNFVRRKNLSTYHDRGNSQATEDTPQLRASKNSVADGSLLDADYIENLVAKVKELKSRMLYFERQCPTPSNTHFDYRNQSIGDCDSTDFQNREKNEKDNVSDSSIYRSKYTSNTRNYMDHQKSIYTTNEQKYSPLYSGNSCFQDSKNKSNKTNVSIVMSMHSSKKNVSTNKTAKPDPKQFQAAAEEFIQQAEDLKSKIAYILDCCGYNTPGSEFTVSSVTSASSKKCFSKRSRSSTRKSSSVNLNDDQMKIINTQYQEILKTLVSIDQSIKGFARAHLASKFGKKVDSNSNTSITSSKLPKKSKNKKQSEPKTKGSIGSNHSDLRIDSKAEMKYKKGRKNKKEDKGCDRESCKALQDMAAEENNKGSSWSCFKVRSTSSDISKDKKSTATKLDSKDKKKASKSKRNDKLEPIVMVYEPIEPNSPGSKNCRRCGKQPHPCKDLCSNRPSSESKKSEKHGFVVTYTPNINSESNTSLCASKKKSGKTPCCFGF